MFVLSKLGRLSIVVLAVAGVALPATPAAAAKTICVGLVVDARSLGGPVSAHCTTVPDGSTGYDVLGADGHTVGFRNDGLICTIDNRPSDGCAAVDAEHYWAYFHRKPGSSSWSYSNEGATTYEPGNGETEGWVWRDGDAAKPDNVAYATICPPAATARPHPRPSDSHAAATPLASPAATSTPSPVTRRTERSRRHKPRAAATSARPTVPPPSTTPPASAPLPSPVTIAAVNSADHGGSAGPPWSLIGVAVVAVALGGAAAVRWRHRGSE